MTSQSDSSETERLLGQLGHGDTRALGKLLTYHRDYIKRVVELRMDDAIRDRLDPSDVVQETQLMVSERIDDFLRRRPTSFRLWLRRETLEKLVKRRTTVAAVAHFGNNNENMKLIKFLATTFLLLASVYTLNGQQLVRYSQYMFTFFELL